MTNEFKKAYERLNPEQKRAVNSLDGPVMVMAGPGTGKTQVLATRIGQLLLQTDVQPQNILALTFTDAAAVTMRDRLVTLIGQPAYSVQIMTFHSFCAQVIETHSDSFPLERNSKALLELEQYQIMGEILEELPLVALRPLNRPLFFLKDCLKAISELKREYILPEDFNRLVSEELSASENLSDLSVAQQRLLEQRLAKQQELATVYAQYQQRLQSARRYDFDDMIGLVVHAFNTDELLLQEYQEQLQYILVDEYQDTNAAQNTLVSLLSSYWGERANVFVVGDPHQSIYRFQGASLENMLGFLAKYPEALVITLKQGYRCGQVIYEAAHRLITEEPVAIPATVSSSAQQVLKQALETQLVAEVAHQGEVEIVSLATQTAELLFIAERVQELRSRGVDLSHIAVLYRKNSQGSDLETVFARMGIPYRIERGANVLDIEFIQQLNTLFQLLYSMSAAKTVDDATAFSVLSYPWMALDSLVLYKLVRIARTSQKQMTELMLLDWEQLQAYQSQSLHPLTKEEHEKLHAVAITWVGLLTLEPTLPFTHWFLSVLQQSGALDWVVEQPDAVELIGSVQGLFAYCQSLAASNKLFRLSDYIQTIIIVEEQGIAIRQEDLRLTKNAVTLSTAHSAKGKEWEHVFVYQAVDSVWGGGRNMNSLPLPSGVLQYEQTEDKKAALQADERRLLYVALTRAKKHVVLTHAEFDIEGARQRQQLPSRFLHAIRPVSTSMDENQLRAFVERAEQQLPALLKPEALPEQTEQKKIRDEFFAALVDTFVLSITALNTYLRDPILFRDRDLLQVPCIKEPFLAYGTAMHRALEFWQSTQLSQKRIPTIAAVLHEYQLALQKETLPAEEYERRWLKGKAVLEEYLDFAALQPVEVLATERRFGSRHAPLYMGDIPLIGRVDRVDLLDKQAKSVRLVDYKTGKPKTIGQIKSNIVSAQGDLSDRELSLPETIRGPYMRQLVFYKLLADIDPSFHYRVDQTAFIFVEPSKSAKTPFISREFVISDQAVSDLRALIETVMREIKQLLFLV